MYLLDDGRYFHSFRQSWVDTYLTICPEQARRVLADTYGVDETDAAAKGTAVHAGIQEHLTTLAPFEDCFDVAVTKFREIAEIEEFRWVKTKTEKTALAHIGYGLDSWWDYVRPTLGATRWCEHEFKFVLIENQDRVIQVTGTSDYADSEGIKDWKLSGNLDKYSKDAWKLKRYHIQPTFYSAAAYYEGLYGPHETVPFQFVNLSMKGGKPQIVDAPRNAQHVEWLKVQLTSIAQQIEAAPPESTSWPLNDQHALCSEKWCLAWPECKGAYVSITSKGQST